MKLSKFVLLSASLLLLAGCGGKKDETTVAAERVEQVRTSLVNKEVVTRDIELSANLQGYENMTVSPSVTGRIEHIYVEVGDKVRKGDTLIRMDRNQLNTTRLQFANLQIEMSRMESLLESDAISKQAYDQTKLAYDQTEETLKFLEENTIVRAQFDGVISAKNYEDGELYSGQPILELTHIAKLKALVNIPESFFTKVKKGMKVDVESDLYPGKKFPATIEVIYPTIDQASHTFTAKLVIPNRSEELRPGMYTTASIDMGREEVLVVPYQSVIRLIGSNERYVYLNDNNVAKRVFITMGVRYDQMVEVLGDDLKVGDEIVTTGQGKLVDGSKLNVVKQ